MRAGAAATRRRAVRARRIRVRRPRTAFAAGRGVALRAMLPDFPLSGELRFTAWDAPIGGLRRLTARWRTPTTHQPVSLAVVIGSRAALAAARRGLREPLVGAARLAWRPVLRWFRMVVDSCNVRSVNRSDRRTAGRTQRLVCRRLISPRWNWIDNTSSSTRDLAGQRVSALAIRDTRGAHPAPRGAMPSGCRRFASSLGGRLTHVNDVAHAHALLDWLEALGISIPSCRKCSRPYLTRSIRPYLPFSRHPRCLARASCCNRRLVGYDDLVGEAPGKTASRALAARTAAWNRAGEAGTGVSRSTCTLSAGTLLAQTAAARRRQPGAVLC